MHQGSRSMTQMEALLETYAYGGSQSLVDTALQLMSTKSTNGGYEFMQQLLRPDCKALKGSAINGRFVDLSLPFSWSFTAFHCLSLPSLPFSAVPWPFTAFQRRFRERRRVREPRARGDVQ